MAYMQGVAFPAFVAMLAKWAPPQEKTTITTAMFAGTFIYLFGDCYRRRKIIDAVP